MRDSDAAVDQRKSKSRISIGRMGRGNNFLGGGVGGAVLLVDDLYEKELKRERERKVTLPMRIAPRTIAHIPPPFLLPLWLHIQRWK